MKSMLDLIMEVPTFSAERYKKGQLLLRLSDLLAVKIAVKRKNNPRNHNRRQKILRVT